jgi:hypothetical protein
MMTEFLHQEESVSEGVFLSTVAFLLLPARRLVVAGFSLRLNLATLKVAATTSVI